MKKINIILVILALFSLNLIGCKDKTQEATQPETSMTTQASSTASKVKMGGDLKICSTNPTTLFPARMRSYVDYLSSAPALESLTHYDETGNMVPWLATGWKIDNVANTVTLTLQKGVKFHDGTDFNAEAVKWNLDLFSSQKREETLSVKSVEVIDENTVQVNLKSWDNTFVSMLGTLMMISPVAFKAHDVDWAIANPIGTGPFQFVSWERDVSLKYKKFNDYWQEGKPYLDSIEFICIADPTVAVASFIQGEEDILLTGTPDDIKSLDESGKYNVVTLSSGGSQLAGIGGDGSNPDSPFAKLEVRKAISYAIDNDAIADSIFKGRAIGVNQWAIPTNWGYNPDLKGYPYDPEKAKQLLANAGYPDGFDTILYGPTWGGTYPLELTAIQGYLSKVGINAELETTGKWSQMIREGWKNSLVYICPKLGSDVSVEMRKTLPSTALIFGKSLIHPEEVDQLIAQATSATSFEEKKALVRQLQQVAFEKYVQMTPIRVQSLTCVKYPYMRGDGINLTESTQWFPQDAWMDK